MSEEKSEICPERLKRLRRLLDKAKAHLMTQRSNDVFISSFVFGLLTRFEIGCTTAWTDGKSICYDPDYIESITIPQLASVIAHEGWHPALGHCDPARRGMRDPMLWNQAIDFVINNMMDNAGYCMMPYPDPDNKGLKICMDHKYDNKSAEEIYDILKKKFGNAPDWYVGDVREFKGSKADIRKAVQRNQGDVIRSVIASEKAGQDPGSLPGELQLLISELVSPKITWDQKLTRYFRNKAESAPNHYRGNKKYHRAGLHMPSKRKRTAGDVAMIFDMSASVSDDEITQFVGDVYHVLKKLPISKLVLTQFDTQIVSETRVRRAEDLFSKVKFEGRGGTDITPVMEWVNEAKPDVAVIFTDGHFWDSEIDPTVPILWIVHNNDSFASSYGVTINYSI